MGPNTTPRHSHTVEYDPIPHQFGVMNIMLMAAALWLTATLAISTTQLDSLMFKDYMILGLVVGIINLVGSMLMILGTMYPRMLRKRLCEDTFSHASFISLKLAIFNGVAVGLLTFDAARFKNPYADPFYDFNTYPNAPPAPSSPAPPSASPQGPPPLPPPPSAPSSPSLPPNVAFITPMTWIVDYQVQQYYACWLIFIFSMGAFLTVSSDIQLIRSPEYEIKVCPAGITTFISLLAATIGLVDAVNDELHNAKTGIIVLAITSALALPLTLHKHIPGYRPAPIMVLHAFVVKAMAVSMFLFLTYDGPVSKVSNEYFGLLVATFSSIYMCAYLTYECFF